MESVKKARALIEETVEVISGVVNVCFLSLVGSIARGHASDNIDLMVGLYQLHDSKIKELANTLVKTLNLDCPPKMFDDALQFKLAGGQLVSMGLYSATELVERVIHYSKGNNLAGEKRPWAISAWFPESFCADLVSAEILYDPEGVAGSFKTALDPYPEELAKALVVLAQQEIGQKLVKLETSTAVNSLLISADLVTCMTRAIFAKNHQYFVGFTGTIIGLQSMDCPLAKKLADLYQKTEVNQQIIQQIIQLAKEMCHEEFNDRRG